ncbi:transcriptional regulator [Brevundimonas intermedia]|uniref:Transcriptional regulator n=1 Tax=Brevundimonas intermedia TaxID=74315 RepID=A0ABQ5TC74_9CAUL|nr:LysR family transcriptional regulator [Brevundimonas intermedia]GLK50440.1 transcriptional regulator [Brevundimonas intermedia]
MTDIKTVDLNLLKALHALLETRSVTRAAERLGLTQPAVSGMLTRLRETFGDPLFVRTQRGVLPTPRAEALAAPLRETLFGIEAMLTPKEFRPAEAALTVRIAATDYAQKAVLVPFVAALRSAAPQVRTSVRPVDLASLGPQMESGDLDMALVTPDMALDTMRSRTLFEEHYVCVMRRGHPAAGAPLDLETFCSLDHALMSHDGSQFRGATDKALAAVGRSRRVAAVVPSFLVLIDLVRHSDLTAMVPSRLVADATDLVIQPPPLTVSGFTKILTWHERLQSDPAQQWLRDTLARCVGTA